MATTHIDYEIGLLRSTTEILLGFIDKNPAPFMSDRVIDSEKIAASAKAIADALHAAAKRG